MGAVDLHAGKAGLPGNSGRMGKALDHISDFIP